MDDDQGTCETFGLALQREGFRVVACGTGQEAIGAAKGSGFDLVVLDLRLPDMPGMEVLQAINDAGTVKHSILVSGFLTVGACAQAMRLGVRDALEKPVDVDDLVSSVRSCLVEEDQPPAIGVPAFDARPRSAAERWAVLVLKACRSEGDLKTLKDWARFVGVSYSSLREHNRVLGLQPQKARDFMRALRALIQSSAHQCEPAAVLDIADHRTLDALIRQAGPCFVCTRPGVPPTQFVRFQHFISANHEAVRVLLTYFDDQPGDCPGVGSHVNP